MSVTDIIAAFAVIGSWIALYFQRRSTKIAERDFNIRLHDVQDIVRRLKDERDTREKQIKERIITELGLKDQHSLGQIALAGAENDFILFKQVILFQTFGLLYFSHKESVLEKSPEFCLKFESFCRSVISYIGSSNYLDNLRENGEPAELNQAVDRMTAVYETVIERGKEIVSELEAIKIVQFSDGSSFEDNTLPLYNMLKSVKDIQAQLIETRKQLKKMKA